MCTYMQIYMSLVSAGSWDNYISKWLLSSPVKSKRGLFSVFIMESLVELKVKLNKNVTEAHWN